MKRIAFYHAFENSLASARKDIIQASRENIAGEVANSVLSVGTVTSVSRLAGEAIPIVDGNSAMAAGFFSSTWVAYKRISNQVEKITAARHIKSILDTFVSYDPIIKPLYEEFQISIEMLSCGDRGMGRLIEFLTNKVLDAAQEQGSHLAIEDESKDENLESKFILRIFEHLHKDDDSLKSVELMTDHNNEYKLKWDLKELILHSPVILLESAPEANGKVYHLQIWLNTTHEKGRWLAKCPAEATHKYPPRIIRDRIILGYLSGFKHEREMLTSPYFLPKEESHILNPKPQLEFHDIIALYFNLRMRRREGNNTQNIENIIFFFQRIIQCFLNKRDAIEAFLALSLVHTLRHIYYHELKGIEGFEKIDPKMQESLVYVSQLLSGLYHVESLAAVAEEERNRSRIEQVRAQRHSERVRGANFRMVGAKPTMENFHAKFDSDSDSDLEKELNCKGR